MPTGIGYLDEVWNPVTGCLPEYPCWARCWARGMAHRFHHSFKPTFHTDRLTQPMRWRKPRRVGVCFTGDLFAYGIADDDIARVFEVMLLVKRHTYVVVTKRAERMASVLELLGGAPDNSWVGVSVSTQPEADDRVKWLLRCRAQHKWISAEPLLGQLDLGQLRFHLCPPGRGGVSLVVVGCESGHGAREMQTEWVRRVRDDCENYGAEFYLKQARWRGRLVHEPLLDGRRHAKWPEI